MTEPGTSLPLDLWVEDTHRAREEMLSALPTLPTVLPVRLLRDGPLIQPHVIHDSARPQPERPKCDASNKTTTVELP